MKHQNWAKTSFLKKKKKKKRKRKEKRVNNYKPIRN
jgi:hypothetical protein